MEKDRGGGGEKGFGVHKFDSRFVNLAYSEAKLTAVNAVLSKKIQPACFKFNEW